jgi:hypothetical protein
MPTVSALSKARFEIRKHDTNFAWLIMPPSMRASGRP